MKLFLIKYLMDFESENDGEGESAGWWGAEREGAQTNLFDCAKPPVTKLKSAGTSVHMLFRRSGKSI